MRVRVNAGVGRPRTGVGRDPGRARYFIPRYFLAMMNGLERKQTEYL
jgi:hypothetical protein